MDTTEPTQEEQKPKRDKLFLYLFIFMTLVCGTLAWLYWSQKNETVAVTTENIQITAESEVVKRDLQQLQTEYEALKTDDETMKKEIEDKKAEIEQLQIQAEKHKNDVFIIAKLKKETKTLRDIMQHFVVEIDSLNTMNKALIASKDSISTELKSEKTKSSTLLTEKEKLFKLGSMLKASDLTVTAVNLKSKDKESETSKAKRTDRVKVSFKLADNNIAPKGKRNVYLRIVTPDGKEWTESADADHLFTFGSSKGYYAAKKTIEYENDEMSVVVFAKKKENAELLPGKYHVDVNIDDTTIGSATLVLE